MTEKIMLCAYICFAWSIVVVFILTILKQTFDGVCNGDFDTKIDMESGGERYETIKKFPRRYLGSKNVSKNK